jgi:hypothetical protein
LVGTLAAASANYSFCAPKEPLCPADFVAGLKRPTTEDLSDDEVAANIDALFGAVAITAAPK